MLDKLYNPKVLEEKYYKIWEDSGSFSADLYSDSEPYTIMMPPPSKEGYTAHGKPLKRSLCLGTIYNDKQGSKCISESFNTTNLCFAVKFPTTHP